MAGRAGEGEITNRDLYNAMEGMRLEMHGELGRLAEKMGINCETQRTDCSTKMGDHDKELASHSDRIARLEYVAMGCIIVTCVAASLWFAHLAGVVPGFTP